MKTIITKVEKYEFGDSFEVRYYERGQWQKETYVESLEEAIERMNFLMEKYDFKDDDVQVCKVSYYKNITDEMPF